MPDHAAKTPTYAEFFCGGGMVRAALQDRWDCVLANDIDLQGGLNVGSTDNTVTLSGTISGPGNLGLAGSGTFILTGANTHDVTQLVPLIDAIPRVRGKRSRPRHRPDEVYADRAYDSEPHRQELRSRGIEPHLATRRTPHGTGLGIFRWVVERTLAWLHQNRRLRTRYERRADIHEAFLSIGCALICWNCLANSL